MNGGGWIGETKGGRLVQGRKVCWEVKGKSRSRGKVELAVDRAMLWTWSWCGRLMWPPIQWMETVKRLGREKYGSTQERMKGLVWWDRGKRFA